MRLILMGPQGSGKGTQAELLSKRYKIKTISLGHILLENIRKRTVLGRLAKPYYNKGKLVPLKIVSNLIRKRINQKDCRKGFILDGYPRTIEQAKVLGGIASIDKVMVLKLPRKEVYKRIAKRYICKCGADYHLIYKPSKVKGICDKCGGELFRREDDTIPAIKKRLNIYDKETTSLIKYYKNKVVKINGDQPIPKVFEDIKKVLKNINSKNPL